MQIKIQNTAQAAQIKVAGLSHTKEASAAKKPDNTAAAMELSKSGRNKARLLAASTTKDDVMAQAEAKIDNLIDTVKSGGTLSKSEEELLSNELQKMSSGHYKDMKDMRLSRDDVLMDLKENFLQRQRIFADMQEKVEAENNADDMIADNRMIASYQLEKEEKERIIEMLKESTGDDEDTKEESHSTENEESTEDIQLEPVDGDAALEVSMKKKAAAVIDGNASQISDVKSQSETEGIAEQEFSHLLDRDYSTVMEVLGNDEASIKDKVDAFEEYQTNSRINAHGREVQRNKKLFDFETWLVAKIQFQGHNDLREVLASEHVLNSQIGMEFIKEFMI